MTKYFPLNKQETERRQFIWDGFYNKRPMNKAAIEFSSIPDRQEIDKEVAPAGDIPLKSSGAHPWLDDDIRHQLHNMRVESLSRYQGDRFPALVIPREKYGQSQALAEIFGAKLVEHESQPGLYHPVPCITTASDVWSLKPKPLAECMYHKAIDYARYIHEAAGGELAVRSPILTGPLDTANYLLGTTALMGWVYEEPEALKKLLDIITDTLIEVINLYQEAVSGHTAPDLVPCAGKGYLVCSEVRHLISLETYCEFEAPYLRRIGEACGPFAVHACGNMERTIRATLGDPNIFAADFQSRETDIALALSETQNKLSFNIRKTFCYEEYEWPDDESYYRYLFNTIKEPAPVCFMIYDIEAYRNVWDELGGANTMFRKL